MTVKTATSGKWYLIVNQSIVRDKWFDTEDEAMRLGDHLWTYGYLEMLEFL